MTKKRLLSYAQHGGSRKSGQLFSLFVIVLLIGIHVRHLHIYKDAHYFSPKFCITFDFHFSWVYSRPQRIENIAYAKFWGEIRCIMGIVEVAYKLLAPGAKFWLLT